METEISKKMDHGTRRAVMCVMAMTVVFIAQNALAFTVPSSGSFAYDLYDLAVNQILKGPVGFVAGVGFIVLCVFAIAKQMVMPAILCLFAGVILIKADSIVATLGGVIA
ncbi:MAG: hypothetical protein P4L51_24145 [Puia sp.]|nr:hypothetical protein [Puia sp.]